jgi:hypothetical protein
VPDLLRYATAAKTKADRAASMARGFTHQVWNEPFSAPPISNWPQIVMATAMVLGGISLWSFSFLSQVLIMLPGILLAGQISGALALTIGRHRLRQNVVAFVPARESVRERVVLVAHLETPAALPVPLTRQGLRWLMWGVVLSLLLLPLICLGYSGSPRVFWLWLSVVPLLGLIAGIGGWVWWEVRRGSGVGALEQGSGVTAALAVAEAVARAPLSHTEVWTLFTGGEGSAGLNAFLDRHDALMRGARFLVLDVIDQEPLGYLLREGVVATLPANADLVDLLQNLPPSGRPLRAIASSAPLPTQAFAALRRGHLAIALRSLHPGTHHTERTCLEQAAALVGALVRSVDQQACAEAEAERIS